MKQMKPMHKASVARKVALSIGLAFMSVGCGEAASHEGEASHDGEVSHEGHHDMSAEEGAEGIAHHVQGECDASQGETCEDAVAELTVGAMAEDADAPQLVQLMLEEAAPAGLAKGFNSMRVRLMDMSGAAMDVGTVTARAWMPDHGHGTPVPPTVTRDTQTGEWQIEGIDLFMGGYWRIYLFSCSEEEAVCCDASVPACDETSPSLMDALYFEKWIVD